MLPSLRPASHGVAARAVAAGPTVAPDGGHPSGKCVADVRRAATPAARSGIDLASPRCGRSAIPLAWRSHGNAEAGDRLPPNAGILPQAIMPPRQSHSYVRPLCAATAIGALALRPPRARRTD